MNATATRTEKLEAAYNTLLKTGRTSGALWNRICADLAKIDEKRSRPAVKLTMENQDLVLGGF